jgi:hypothetical protein
MADLDYNDTMYIDQFHDGLNMEVQRQLALLDERPHNITNYVNKSIALDNRLFNFHTLRTHNNTIGNSGTPILATPARTSPLCLTPHLWNSMRPADLEERIEWRKKKEGETMNVSTAEKQDTSQLAARTRNPIPQGEHTKQPKQR